MGAASSCFGGDKPAQTSAQDKSLAVTRTQSRGGGGAGNTHLHTISDRYQPPDSVDGQTASGLYKIQSRPKPQ